jgi:hypothetical protein
MNRKADPLTYSTWVNMKTRCNNPKSTQYEWYGQRGIKVCAEWQDFAAFLRDVGERPSKAHTLDRFPDKNGNYEPGNVRWATQKEQRRNTRSNRAVIRSDGVKFGTLAEAAEASGGDSRNLWKSIREGFRHCGFNWKYDQEGTTL